MESRSHLRSYLVRIYGVHILVKIDAYGMFVSRDTSSAPVNITNGVGRIVLYQNNSFVSGPGGLGML